jgi:hypothetical protein
MRLLERADLARPGMILRAEELLLDAIRRHGGRVQHDERAILAQR